jgi:FkbM family methyltransferase
MFEHPYKAFSILLPSGHLLPAHQQVHPKYDRFLPHLARFIDRDATIVDIGANCGDTLAGMVDQNPGVHYICIEPDEQFFHYLNINIQRMKNALPALQVEAVQSLVGLEVSNVALEGSGGTKHAVVGKGEKSSRKLDEILSEYPDCRIQLIKSDVDGFDYDVLNSAKSVLQHFEPLIFFECQCDAEYQKAGYEKTIARLMDSGYKHWVLFDNFGQMMLRTNDARQISQMLNYVWQQGQRASTRTIYYYDMLAFTDQNAALADTVLQSYLSFPDVGA